MNTPEQVIATARVRGTRRSAEYWQGALDVLRYRMQGIRIVCPYREGSVQFDAYFAGNDRGHHQLWREQQESGATSAHPFGQKHVHGAQPRIHATNC